MTTNDIPTSTPPDDDLDVALAQLAATLLDPHQHTPHTALTALADGGTGLPAALRDGYAIPDISAPTPDEALDAQPQVQAP